MFLSIIFHRLLRIRIIYPESYVLGFSTLSFVNFILVTEYFLRQKISYNSHTVSDNGGGWNTVDFLRLFFIFLNLYKGSHDQVGYGWQILLFMPESTDYLFSCDVLIGKWFCAASLI